MISTPLPIMTPANSTKWRAAWNKDFRENTKHRRLSADQQVEAELRGKDQGTLAASPTGTLARRIAGVFK